MFKTRGVWVIKCEFCTEESSEGTLISEISAQTLYGVQFFESSSYQDLTMFINFQNFLLKFN